MQWLTVDWDTKQQYKQVWPVEYVKVSLFFYRAMVLLVLNHCQRGSIRFCQRGSNSTLTTFFFFFVGREDPNNTTKRRPSSSRQTITFLNGVSLAGRSWPNIDCWLGSFVIFQGIRTSIAKEPYSIVIFRGGGERRYPYPCPPPHLDPRIIVCCCVRCILFCDEALGVLLDLQSPK